MKKTLVDLLIEKRKREEKYFKGYLGWAKRIKKEAEDLLGKTEVFVFGSAAKGEATPGSDIDLAIISKNLNTPQKKSKVRTAIWQRLGFLSPFELHLVTPKEFSWYKRFIDKKVRI